MVCPGRSWPLPEEGQHAVPFLHCARDLVVGDMPRQSAAASEDKAGYMSYVWQARRYYMRPSKKRTSLRSWREHSGFALGCGEWVTVHYGGVGPFRIERRGAKKHSPKKRRNGGTPVANTGRISLRSGQWVLQTRCKETTAKHATIQQPLLSNGSANKHVSMARIYRNKRREVFYGVRAEIFYARPVSSCSRVKGMLGFSHCDLLLLGAGRWRRGTSVVGSRYQAAQWRPWIKTLLCVW
jgi:hypothetical protein